jgi:3-mercaptopyruvate sulfurtransferase SseA
MFSRITPRQVVARMSKGERVAFVDARRDEARKAAGVRLTGAVPVHLSTIVRDAAQVPQHCLLVVYGDDDGALDVPRVAEELRALGFGEVRILAGGFAGWLELRYPVQPADEAIAA